jgi:hypothetical protein
MSTAKELTLFDKRDEAVKIIFDEANTKNPNSIKDIQVAIKVKTKLNQLRGECENE